MPEDWAFVAMIRHRKGHRAEALRRLDQLAAWQPAAAGRFWHDRQIELLRREAEALIRPVQSDLPADVFAPDRGTP